MKRILASAVVTAVMLAGTGSGAEAQSMINRRASLFDVGVYAGGSYTTKWAETSIGNLGPSKWNPVFGAQATYWINPMLGVRANGTYMPSGWGYRGTDLPGFTGKDGRDVNNWFYDLDLMIRPFFFRTASPAWLSSIYFFLGGGGLTTNVAGEGGCREPDTFRSVCLPRDAKHASVGQGTAGVGLDLFSLFNHFGVFVEYGAHGYESPAHTGPGWTGVVEPAGTSDKFAVTQRGVLGLKMSFGNILPPPPVPVAPAPPPPPPPPPAPPAERAITVCVVQDQMLTTVNAMYNPTTGDTTVMGRRFSEAHPATAPTYVAGSTWYVNNEPIMYNGRRYVKFGLPRTIGTTDVMRSGAYQGTNVFVETGTTGTPTVIYLPVQPGCVFQPYQAQAEIKVRG
jgi:hypothetical protein